MQNIFRSLISYGYLNIYQQLRGIGLSKELLTNVSEKTDSTRIAFICDEMTWCDYSPYCCSLFIHPMYWRKQLEMFRPDILFCESAWCGLDRYHNCWRSRVYKDNRVCFDNRRVLLNILDYCRQNDITTVFWNKEDPTYFNNKTYDYVSTALLFDHIYTTAEECIEKYEKLRHKNVHLMPFGVNLDMFSKRNDDFKPNTAVFAGSWFADQEQRCRDLSALLDYVIDSGLKLDIYDRKSDCHENRFRFPEKYQKYIHPAVSYRNIAEVYSRYEYAVNVNTVNDSSTMFSRRVLQLAAVGNKVISNSFAGIDSISDAVEIIDRPNENIIIFKGEPTEIKKHSCEIQINTLIEHLLNNSQERVYAFEKI